MTERELRTTKLREIFARLRGAGRIPAREALCVFLERLNGILYREDPPERPRDSQGLPGGLVHLSPFVPTIVLPDIHARPGLITAALSFDLSPGLPVLDALAEGVAQLVCVGDYFHGEGRVRGRWAAALEEYLGGYDFHSAMDQEMSESLAAFMMLTALKISTPHGVHLLKGNHENVANEEGFGNHPFVKFANEGEMVRAYLSFVYGEEVLSFVYRAEKGFPLLAVGRYFLVGHAEPRRAFSAEEIIDYRDQEEVIHGMTWTDNDEAEPDAVEKMLRLHLSPDALEGARYFGGHRPVAGRFSLRAGGRYVQIHNPQRYVIAILPPDRAPNPEIDVVDLGPNEDARDDAGA